MSSLANSPLEGITLAGDDKVVPFEVAPLDIRGRAVQLGPMLNGILSRHDYPAPVATLLGEAVVLTVLLGTSLKFDGKFILQTQTDGPVSLLVADFRTPDAVRAYRTLNSRAIGLVRPGGVLVTSSCSFHIYRETFEDLLRKAGRDSGRRLRILERGGPGRDHPILLGHPETEYLKCLFLRVD